MKQLLVEDRNRAKITQNEAKVLIFPDLELPKSFPNSSLHFLLWPDETDVTF